MEKIDSILNKLYHRYYEIKKIKPTEWEIAIVKSIVEKHTGIPASALSGKGRKREKIMAAKYFSAAMKIFTNLSYNEIGFSTRNDHATVYARVKTLYNLYQTEKGVKEIFDDIIEETRLIFSKRSPKRGYKFMSKELFKYALQQLQRENENCITIEDYDKIINDKDREIRFLKNQIERMKIKEINYNEK